MFQFTNFIIIIILHLTQLWTQLPSDLSA